MSRPSRDGWAMQVAVLTAQRTTCLRRAVGAVLVNSRGHVLATGYNGVAAGQPHCNEAKSAGTDFEDLGGDVLRPRRMVTVFPHACPGAQALSGTQLDGCHAIHAEQNALLQCRDVYDISDIYVTTPPCMTCTKLLLNTSCKRIVCQGDYPQAEAAKTLWESSGRVWENYSE